MTSATPSQATDEAKRSSGSGALLVTGATGFTGGALARELRRRGQHVRALVRDAARARDLDAAGVEVVLGDICNRDSVDRAVAGCRRVYHVAALYRSAGHPARVYHEVNAQAVDHVLQAARRHGVERTVHCSTVGVHGHVTTIPSDESAPYKPGDIYQETKLAGERIALAAIQSGQPVSIVRPTGIFGPGDLRFLKLFRTIQRGTFRMFGSGEIAFHLTYIDDMVDGIILCGEHPAAIRETFIIASDEYVSLNELVRSIADTLGVKPPRGHFPMWPLLAAAQLCELACRPFGIDPPLHTRRCEFFVKARAFSNAKARRLLGFEPRVALVDGLRRTADWYVTQKMLAPFVAQPASPPVNSVERVS